MLNKLSSDVVTTIVGMAKSEKPTANEVKSNHTEVTGRGIPNSRITVILPNGADHVGYVSAEGEFRIMIPKQEANSSKRASVREYVWDIKSAIILLFG